MCDNKKIIQFFPEINSQEVLRDILARAAWHFSHLPNVDIFVPISPDCHIPKKLKIPEGFDPLIQAILDQFLPRVCFQHDQFSNGSHKALERADVILKHIEGNAEVDHIVSNFKKPTFRVDPNSVRYEGSFYIQCALELFHEKDVYITDSRNKFYALLDQLGGGSQAWIMATGPTVESYSNYDFDNSVVIVCNSVALNEDLMNHCNPSVLVFADPIFHFGVSEYAGRFREVVEARLSATDLNIIVPFKYYPLLLSKLPKYAERIIGIPFEKIGRHNFDLNERFLLKTTANILTLLLLPLATTLARKVNLIGCDGRPLEQDDYFWGHGKSVQINDKMENIKRVHPGFFAIDYNEYYFEHCHTLANLLEQAEDAGWRFAHHGPSHIPALRDRPAERLSLPLLQARADAAQARQGNSKACVVLEPDGVGMTGHYVRWHRNLITELNKSFERVDVLCNCKQDPALYPCPARPVFTSFSWSVSRSDYCFRRDFSDNPSFKRFVDELLEGIRAQHDPLPPELSLYVYYGSVQILKAVQLVRKELLRQGTNLRAFVCLFHESVILDTKRTEPRFPPNAAEILLESAAQIDNYRVASVTGGLAELVLAKFGVATTIYPNPTPDLSDAESATKLQRSLAERKVNPAEQPATVLFPTNPRDEKGEQILRDLVEHLRCYGVPEGQRYLLRGKPPAGSPSIPGVEYLGEEINDESYWHNLRNADVAVVPYLAPAFTYRTSGILVDTLVSALPVVVLADTWLADVVKRTGAGLAVKYQGPVTLISAVKVLLTNREMFRRRVSRGGRTYLTENTWVDTAGMAIR